MKHSSSSSSATITMMGVLLLAVVMITCLGGATSAGNDQAEGGEPQCSNGGDPPTARLQPGPRSLSPNWGYYVEQVLSALETTTPNTATFSYTFGYPDPTAAGNPLGSAACRTTTLDVAGCEACLSGVKVKLESCKAYAFGSFSNGDCNMAFSQISP